MSQYENNSVIYTPDLPGTDGLRRFVETLGAPLAGLLNMLLAWRERARSRHQLAGLDDYMLRDIGVDRASAAAESDKAFWNS